MALLDGFVIEFIGGDGQGVFGKIVAVRDFGIDRSGVGDEGTVDVAGDFEGVLAMAFEAFGIVFGAESFGGLIAILLESVNLAGEAAEGTNGAGVRLGFGGELLAGPRVEKEFGELSGGELEADFRNLSSVVFAEVFGEVILMKAKTDSVVLFGDPFFVAASGFPIGDVALGNVDAVFIESINDFGVLDVVLEHEIDHVALEFGEARDFPVAGLWFESAGGTFRALDIR